MRLATLTTSILAGCLFVGDLADFSPNAQRFHKLYGEPTIEFFSVRKGIMMAVEYGPDREACELLIGPTQSLIQRGNQEPMSSPAVSDLLQE